MSDQRDFDEFLAKFKQHHELVTAELHKVVIGQDEVIEQLLAAIFTGGHCLLVGVPGLAKTLLVSTLAKVLDVNFKRIQFTPDLMPSDITGTNVLDEDDAGKRDFRFVHGPVFTNVLLADEINRTPPKTQAALLQSMQEKEVSVGQTTYDLPDPFFVIATQNPIEQEGTYPLPEAQLDRFMFNVKVDYPSLDEEEQILKATTGGAREEVRKVLSAKSIVYLQKQIAQVEATPRTIQYVTRLVRATRPRRRPQPAVREGPRGLGRRPARRAVPDPGRQGDRRDGRPPQRDPAGRAAGRRSCPPPPPQHELPGPGGGAGQRQRRRAAGERGPGAGDPEV